MRFIFVPYLIATRHNTMPATAITYYTPSSTVEVSVRPKCGFACTPKQADYIAALARAAGVNLPTGYNNMCRTQAMKAITAFRAGKRVVFV